MPTMTRAVRNAARSPRETPHQPPRRPAARRWRAGAAKAAIVLIAVLLSVAGAPKAVRAGGDGARELLTKARITVERMLADPDYHKLHDLLRNAKGVLIFPSLLKGGFFIGGEGGNGVLLARDMSGQWSGPAFFTLGSVSLGVQFGVEDSETIFAVMTDRGIDSILGQKVKLGADASVAVGPVGIGAEAAATAQLADLYSFSRARGAFAGVSFEGAYIHPREDMNQSVYGQPAAAQQIVVERRFDSPLADPLRTALAEITP